MFKLLQVTALTAAFVFFAGSVHAADLSPAEDADSLGYDAIVDQLNKENASQEAVTRAKVVRPRDDSSLDNVWMHGGVGLANTIESLRLDDGTATTLNQRGLQASLGIDLFSVNWMAEGSVRAFAEDGDSKVRSSLKEFELKLLYKDRIAASRFGYRAGLGLTGRYLTVKQTGFADQDYTTPASVAVLGGDLFINDRFSLGADMSARTSLIGETIDHSSFDLTLRVDAHF